jgi:hypothetical protein
MQFEEAERILNNNRKDKLSQHEIEQALQFLKTYSKIILFNFINKQ